MRQTRQRAAILNLLQNTETHPTADWVYQEVRKTLPRISLGTVYRTLDALCQEGLVKALPLDSRKRRFDGNPGAHAHIVCMICEQVADVDAPMHPDVIETVAQATGFEVRQHRLEWYGICPQCAALSGPDNNIPTK